MPATLQQIQAKLAEAIALRDDAIDAMPFVIAAAGSIATEASARHQAKLNGYQREVELLMKCERDLIANGRLDGETARLAESRFNASGAAGAVITMPVSNDAQMAPREAPRSGARLPTPNEHELALPAPLPASGDVF